MRELSSKFRYAWRMLLAAACLTAPLYSHYVQAQHSVYLYNWEAFLSPVVIDKLRNTHQTDLKQIYFSDEAVRDELLLSERGKTIDLVMVESVRLQRLGKLGAVKPIKALREELADRFDPKWVAACGDYGIPYAWGTSGIVFRGDEGIAVTSWRDLLEPSEALRGRVSMYFHPVDLIGAALLAAELDPLSEREQDLQVAHKMLEKQRPYLSSTDYILDAIGDEKTLNSLEIAFGFSGDHHVLNSTLDESEPKWQYVLPKEGTIIWLECLAIPEGQPLSDQTLQVIKYLTGPEIAALNARTAWFSTPNRNVEYLLGEQYLNDKAINPDLELISNSYLYRPLSDRAQLLRQRIVEDLR
jgi:spermidine/putrescine transport system substrate-binding protein